METFQWTNPINRAVSICGLRKYETSTRKIIIATELSSNTGMSLTNGLEYAWPQICKHIGWNPADVLKIEHYEEEDTYDIVTNIETAQWEHIDKSLLEHYINEKL